VKLSFRSLKSQKLNNSGVWAVVPAAGIGTRMDADKPKQYLTIANKTILELTLQRLTSHPHIKGVVVAISEDDDLWPKLNKQFDCPVYTASGGKERSDSVLNALIKLAEIDDNDPWVLVHDAARPCLRHEDIDRMLQQLLTHPVGGILGIPITDTVKRIAADNSISSTVSRQGLWRASTPQMFHLQALTEVLQTAIKNQQKVTDEASAMEMAGYHPLMVEGHADNIKITIPQDLALASLFLSQQQGDDK